MNQQQLKFAQMKQHQLKFAQRNQGEVGIMNLGATCYLNSCIQILCHSPAVICLMNHLIDFDIAHKDPKFKHSPNVCKHHDEYILAAFAYMFQDIWSAKQPIASSEFMIKGLTKMEHSKRDVQFSRTHQQHDASEFLMMLIDAFHNATKEKGSMMHHLTQNLQKTKTNEKCYELLSHVYEKDYSNVWKIFYWIQVSTITHVESQKELSSIPEQMFILSLEIPALTEGQTSVSLKSCLDQYTKGEMLEGDNAYEIDEKTKEKVSAMRQLRFWSLPETLVISLKRFDWEGNKNMTLVSFDHDLDMNPYMVECGGNDTAERVDNLYELYAVCNHHGAMNIYGKGMAHYTAEIKHALTGTWNMVNDHVFQPNVATDQFPHAYCLFYTRKHSSAGDYSAFLQSLKAEQAHPVEAEQAHPIEAEPIEAEEEPCPTLGSIPNGSLIGYITLFREACTNNRFERAKQIWDSYLCLSNPRDTMVYYEAMLDVYKHTPNFIAYRWLSKLLTQYTKELTQNNIAFPNISTSSACAVCAICCVELPEDKDIERRLKIVKLTSTSLNLRNPNSVLDEDNELLLRTDLCLTCFGHYHRHLRNQAKTK